MAETLEFRPSLNREASRLGDVRVRRPSSRAQVPETCRNQSIAYPHSGLFNACPPDGISSGSSAKTATLRNRAPGSGHFLLARAAAGSHRGPSKALFTAPSVRPGLRRPQRHSTGRLVKHTWPMLALVIAGIRFAQPSARELAAGRDVRPQPYGGHPTPLSAPEIPGPPSQTAADF